MRRSINGIKDVQQQIFILIERFYKDFLEKRVAKKSILAKVGKKCKHRFTVAILVVADRSNVTSETFS